MSILKSFGDMLEKEKAARKLKEFELLPEDEKIKRRTRQNLRTALLQAERNGDITLADEIIKKLVELR